MAASSKPTGVHVALAVSILLNIVLFVCWLVVWRGMNGSSDMKRELDSAKSKASEADTRSPVAQNTHRLAHLYVMFMISLRASRAASFMSNAARAFAT